MNPSTLSSELDLVYWAGMILAVGYVTFFAIDLAKDFLARRKRGLL